MKRFLTLGLVFVLGGVAVWAAQQYSVDALRCSELRITFSEADGAVTMLRGEILPMSEGSRVGSVRTYGFTLDADNIPENITTTLETLRTRAETWAENQTGWVSE